MSETEKQPVENKPSVNHSPEPWALFAGGTPGNIFEIRCATNGAIIAIVLCNEGEPVTIEDLANGALIGAAPRLLRVLRTVSDCYTTRQQGSTPWADAWRDADQVLADLRKAGVY